MTDQTMMYVQLEKLWILDDMWVMNVLEFKTGILQT